MINESFYIAICFIALIVLIYQNVKNFLDQYLTSNINKIATQIEEAKQINAEAEKIFTQAQKHLDNFTVEKEQKIAKAHAHAQEVCSQYIINTQNLLQARNEDFSKQIEQLQNEFIEKARNKIASLSYEVVAEAIKHEKFNISNKIN